MNSDRQDMGTLTEEYEETVEDRYHRCGLLNAIQHIDIYGKSRVTYVETPRYHNDPAMAVSAISSTGRSFNSSDIDKTVSDKVSKFTVRTKMCSLYPGHDILSKKRRCAGGKSEVRFGSVKSEKLGLGE